MSRKIILNKDLVFKKYKIDKMSSSKIAKELGISIDTVVANLKRYNIESNTLQDYASIQKVFLNETQQEVLNGALLGDGCITKGRVGNALLVYSSAIRNHVEYVSGFFHEYLTKEGLVTREVIDRRTAKTYIIHRFRTIADCFWTDIYNHWYPDGTKHIPKDLKLTPIVCLLWYIGDGCLNTRGQSIFLATDCFSKEEQAAILLPQLQKFEARLVPHNTKTKKDVWRIQIPRKKVLEFLEYIGPCPITEYTYKWDYQEYKHAPPQDHKTLESQICELYTKGHTYYRVGKMLGVEPNVAKHYLIKNNLYKGAKHDD